MHATSEDLLQAGDVPLLDVRHELLRLLAEMGDEAALVVLAPKLAASLHVALEDVGNVSRREAARRLEHLEPAVSTLLMLQEAAGGPACRGARSSITSLWKVGDAATRRPMELFYTELWAEKLPKADALWQAKRVLREEGAPARDWAGWVLSGVPD